MVLSFLKVAVSGMALFLTAQAVVADDAAVARGLIDCPVSLGNRGDAAPYSTTPFECHCTAAARKQRGGYAFGSDPYDGISNICMAALHAGATGPEGGNVRVIPGPVQDSYKGTLANGVFSADWDHPSQFGSFWVEAATGAAK